MADINLDTAGKPATDRLAAGHDAPDEIVALIELLFFAYRDFVSDPDHILDNYGFGRAHHRVIHFVGRNPGMHVAELLDILRITKQSLSRVLRDLIDKGFVYQREGSRDRRQRLLYLTPEGSELHGRLITPQIARIRSALGDIDTQTSEAFREALFAMIDQDDRHHVLSLIGDAGKPPA
ncbi:MAG: MarR family transcriptional regulator [Rhizobiales bacterium]|nr:MarR family transcriptional regulator [Hyphomicrobiales bacterium]